ncbi:MAG: hypothetical protein WD768_06840 [Phycisphaeraceae bacterium]
MFLALAGCRSPTQATIPMPYEQVVTALREEYQREVQEHAWQGMSRLKEVPSRAGIQFEFVESLDKAWSIETTVTVEPTSAGPFWKPTATRLTVLTIDDRLGIPWNHRTQRQDIEGLRMAQILRLIVPDKRVSEVLWNRQ